MATIASIETTYVRVPLALPMRSAAVDLSTADHVIVRVRDTDGATGTAEAIPRPMMYGETVGTILAIIRDEMAPRVVGHPVEHLSRLRDQLDVLVGNPSAKAALELACLDLQCRRLSVPLHQFLGGVTDQVQVTAVLSDGRPGDVVDEAIRFRERYGITSFKFKIGRGVKDDLATTGQLRESLGADVEIYPDANRAYDARSALSYATAAEAYELRWLEEPTPASDILDRRRLVERSPIPVLADDSVWSPEAVVREVLAERTTAVSLKIARSGHRDAERIRGFCESVGAPIVIGSQGDTGLGTAFSLAFAASRASTCRYPAELGYVLRMEGDLLMTSLPIRDGVMHVPKGPGTGVELDEDAISRWEVA